MSTINKLPLSSPLWNAMESFDRQPGRIPILIKGILEDKYDGSDQQLETLTIAIFNEYSITTSTFAVFPYLFEIWKRYEKTNPQLFFLAANIAACYDLERINIPNDIRQYFTDALVSFENIAVPKLLVGERNFRNIYAYLCAAMAFSGHCCGKLIMDVLEREGTKRTGLYCPHCQEPLDIYLFDEGIVAVRPGTKASPPQNMLAFSHPSHRDYPERRPNPWQGVNALLSKDWNDAGISPIENEHVRLAINLCNKGFSAHMLPEHGFSLIGSILLAHGFRDSARRFYRFSDTIDCPACRSVFMLARGWWGCAQRSSDTESGGS